MHGKLNRKKIKRASAIENAFVVIIGVLSLVAVVVMDNHGAPRRWHAAIGATLIPFGFVVYAYRRRLLRWSFWPSFAACLLVHGVLIFICFQYILRDVEYVSILIWFPVAFVEAWLLLIAMKRVEEKLTGKHETIKLSF
ncbi:MAG: hypothetical protein NVS9B4_16890 [Candidatus Acidiferrum sp.]